MIKCWTAAFDITLENFGEWNTPQRILEEWKMGRTGTRPTGKWSKNMHEKLKNQRGIDERIFVKTESQVTLSFGLVRPHETLVEDSLWNLIKRFGLEPTILESHIRFRLSTS